MNDPITTPVLVLVGPTAIGKTDLSLALALRFGCEIISMDSMQVYRGMDIGTAKVSAEERRRVAHHLIDIRDPDQQYDAASFVSDARAAIRAIAARGRIPLLTGGTGLYLSALTKGLFAAIEVKEQIREQLRQRLEQEGREGLYQELVAIDPVSAGRIHSNDSQRLLRGLEIYQATGIPWSEHLRRQALAPEQPSFPCMLQLGLCCERGLLRQRIQLRSQQMMAEAFRQEVESLLARGYGWELPAMQAIGYRHMGAYIQGKSDLATATQALIQDTGRYGKRQMTWFRRQSALQWYDRGQPNQVIAAVAAFLKVNR